MRLAGALLIMTVLPLMVCGQELIFLTTLQESIRETSGLVYLDHKLITHNDSGGLPELYEIDSITGEIVRTVVIGNATNIDWEDLCYDSTYLYIGDFGNNGSRNDLKIYRLPISSYLGTETDTVMVDTIHFNYSDQTDFAPAPFSTNFDAEAFFSYNDSLYIFTKNWGNNWTNIYALPNLPGKYEISKVDSINAQGLVTGATYNFISNTILLLGYTFVSPFIIEISDFTSGKLSIGTMERYLLPPLPGRSIQMEGITSLSNHQYYISAEEFSSLSSALYRLDTHHILGLESHDVIAGSIYPNPSSDFVFIKYNNLSRVEIYDLQGVLQKISADEHIFISDLRDGVYIVHIIGSGEDDSVNRKLIIEK